LSVQQIIDYDYLIGQRAMTRLRNLLRKRLALLGTSWRPSVLSLAPGITITRDRRGTVVAEVYDINWPQGDSAFHAVHVGSNGKVYFTVSSHAAGQPAHLFEFDPHRRIVRKIWDTSVLLANDASVAQGKIHSPLAEINGELFGCTHSSWFREDHTDPHTGRIQSPYPGGCVFAVHIESGQGRIIAGPLDQNPATAFVRPPGKMYMKGQGVVTGVFDIGRKTLYAISWPSAIFLRVNLLTGAVRSYGPQQENAETVPRSGSGYQMVLRTLGLDDDGNVYGSTGRGQIWKYDPVFDQIVLMNSRMENGTRAKLPVKVPWYNMWRTVLWSSHERAFYGIHWSTSWLFRFDPRTDQIAPVAPWRACHMITAAKNPNYAAVGLAMGPDDVLYGFVHAPSLKKSAIRSLHLLTYDIKRKLLKDHGEILGQDGKAVMFAQSCAVAPNGDVYTVGWVEVEQQLRAELTKMREIGPIETRGFPYLMALVRIPADRI
jgi:hypothetical protein